MKTIIENLCNTLPVTESIIEGNNKQEILTILTQKTSKLLQDGYIIQNNTEPFFIEVSSEILNILIEDKICYIDNVDIYKIVLQNGISIVFLNCKKYTYISYLDSFLNRKNKTLISKTNFLEILKYENIY